MSVRTAAEVADELRISKRKVTELATKLGLGANVGGSAGFRFQDADVDALWDAMKPAPVVAIRRRRRSS